MVQRSRLVQRLEALGHWFFYITLRFFGLKGANLLLVPAVFCYVVFSAKMRRTVRPYLERRFPEENRTQYFFHTFYNVLSFGKVLVERGWLGTVPGATLKGEARGYTELIDTIQKGRGMVLLIAHMGNWQSALVHLGELPVTVNALMQYDQEAVAKHYFDLQKAERPFEIIDADGDFGGMVEALTALNRGEVVTIMGDRFVKGSSTPASFLGSEVRFPDSAYMLAASAGAPVAVVFAAQEEPGQYTLQLWDLFYPEYTSRDERGQMLMDCTMRFARALEKYVKLYPYQWYNFYNFWKQ